MFDILTGVSRLEIKFQMQFAVRIPLGGYEAMTEKRSSKKMLRG